jgi:hypothetical protein
MSQLSLGGCADPGIEIGLQAHRLSWRQMDDQERNKGDPDQERQGKENPFDDMAKHR